jgi:hypothetical protein
MVKPQTAIVVVRKDWVNTSWLSHLINRGNESRSTGDTHLITADLGDENDQRGLWLKNVHVDHVTKDGSRFTMRFMIPWSVIIALGVVDHGTQTPPGFAQGFTSGADFTDQSTAE